MIINNNQHNNQILSLLLLARATPLSQKLYIAIYLVPLLLTPPLLTPSSLQIFT